VSRDASSIELPFSERIFCLQSPFKNSDTCSPGAEKGFKLRWFAGKFGGGVWVALILATGAGCKKNTEGQLAATSSPSKVSAFVTREHGYIDTAVGRKHVVSMAARIGIKKLFVDMWSRGCTLFKSNIMKKYGAQEICKEAEGDPLSDFMRYGKQFGVEIVPWFEWGNIVPEKSILWQKNKNKGWSGFKENFHTVPAIRINPYKGSFENFMSELLKESAAKYGAKEVHICDNFAPHLRFGAATLAIKGPKTFTAFMYRVTSATRAAGVKVSLSSQRHMLSLEHFSIEWTAWLKNKSIYKVYPQLYHVRENKKDQFLNEAKSERNAGASGLALYSGPGKNRWSLSGVGHFAKTAHSLGLEVILFDINTLLKNTGAHKDEHVRSIAAALGTQPKATTSVKPPVSPTTEPKPRQPELQDEPPPPPVLPSPEEPEVIHTEVPRPSIEPSPQAEEPKNPRKNGICEYMKVIDSEAVEVPTFASASKGQILEYLQGGDLVYRHLSQIGVDGEAMMYVSIQSGQTANRVRWVQAKFLQERNPESPYCNP